MESNVMCKLVGLSLMGINFHLGSHQGSRSRATELLLNLALTPLSFYFFKDALAFLSNDGSKDDGTDLAVVAESFALVHCFVVEWMASLVVWILLRVEKKKYRRERLKR
jgi:hypothetical protein